MPDRKHTLTLAHSPDPDDAFMWWPITGKIHPSQPDQLMAPPVLDTGRFTVRALPADIEALNRRAAEQGDLEITAISFRNACEVKDRYAVTACGSSFGDGFGPKLVAPEGVGLEVLADPARVIAVPGRRTTAFLVLGIMMLESGGLSIARARELLAPGSRKFVELPFEQIIPAIAQGKVAAGLVIHEGQILFEQAGLGLLADVGAWWKQTTGLALPLGANAVRRDLDALYGAGTMREISRLCRRSIDYALSHRAEGLEYTMPFALANADRSGRDSGEAPTIERVDRYVSMYVNRWTLDVGEDGRESIFRLLGRGHELGLCTDPTGLEIVACD